MLIRWFIDDTAEFGVVLAGLRDLYLHRNRKINTRKVVSRKVFGVLHLHCLYFTVALITPYTCPVGDAVLVVLLQENRGNRVRFFTEYTDFFKKELSTKVYTFLRR